MAWTKYEGDKSSRTRTFHAIVTRAKAVFTDPQRDKMLRNAMKHESAGDVNLLAITRRVDRDP